MATVDSLLVGSLRPFKVALLLSYQPQAERRPGGLLRVTLFGSLPPSSFCRCQLVCLGLTCERVTPSVPCPVCGTAAHRIHSRYQRSVWDLSVQNVQVLLHLHVRKFYCDQPNCRRRIFTERLPQVTSPHGRFTFGLRQFLGQLGGEQGGASAARSATLQGLQVTARAM